MIQEVRPYSIIVQYSGAFYEVILFLTNEEMLAWDNEVDLETIHCITDMSHMMAKPSAGGAVCL